MEKLVLSSLFGESLLRNSCFSQVSCWIHNAHSPQTTFFSTLDAPCRPFAKKQNLLDSYDIVATWCWRIRPADIPHCKALHPKLTLDNPGQSVGIYRKAIHTFRRKKRDKADTAESHRCDKSVSCHRFRPPHSSQKELFMSGSQGILYQ